MRTMPTRHRVRPAPPTPERAAASGYAAPMDKELTDHADAETADVVADPADAVVEEQLIEEISIDGMCGVY